MGPLYTAIIHLREPVTPIIHRMVLPSLGTIRGVINAEYDAVESLLAITYNTDEARLPEIVRMIEDLGSAVASVAQRKAHGVRAA